ncbi:MAG: COX15/CtaA family protein [Phycisphaerales bacterium]|jgi:cytochrome c oxidase assembly protein subunit 15|nr:COX15/CtaA family protein [Phycisphaerales bacterium]
MRTLETVARTLTLAFAATTAMWMFSYVSLLFAGPSSGEVLFILAGLSLAYAGVVNATCGGSSLQSVWIGSISAFLNLMLLGSLVGGSGSEEMFSKGFLWFALLFGGSVGLTFIGSKVGSSMRPNLARVDWQYRFFVTAAVLVFLMLVTGGLVTGMEAGLAVPDWPNSYGHNMLLYPLTEMVSSENEGVFYEHAHRLTGMFVGITSLVLLACAFRWSTRKTMRTVATVIFLLVCLQGLLGGLRVTGHLTLSQDRELLNPNVWIGVVHGVVGQLIFAGFVWLAAMMAPSWRAGLTEKTTNSKDVLFGWLLLGSMVFQLVLGAVYRHMLGVETLAPKATHVLYTHIAVAFLVLIFAVLFGLRLRDRGMYPLKTFGVIILALVGLQLLLGGGALIAVLLQSGDHIPMYEVILTTLHQANGALLLGASAAGLAWARWARSLQ